MNSIMRRHSTRRFLDRPVGREKLESLFRAAMQSPTGHNVQDWEFLVVTDEQTRIAVSGMSQYSMCAKNAPVNIIVLANLERAWGSEKLWVCDMGAVCQTLLIQAEEEGLGAVWLAAYPNEGRIEYLRGLFGLGESLVPYAVIPVGYKQREKPFEDRFDETKIHWEKY